MVIFHGVLMGFNGIEHSDLMDYEWDIPSGKYSELENMASYG